MYNTANSILGDLGAHCLNTGEETLGIAVSRETGATDPLDPDRIPNLVDADSDEWKLVEIDISTTPASARLMFDVTVAPTAPDVERYINVLVDFDQNGKWKGDANGKEWAVINYEVDVDAGMTEMITVPVFDWGNGMVVPSPVWVRVSLTRSKVDETRFNQAAGGWDGSGQFDYGEIEDCLVVLTWTGPDNKPRPSDPPVEDGPEPGELPKVKHSIPVSNYAVIVNGGDHRGQSFVQASYNRMKKVLGEQGYDEIGEFGPDATPAGIGQHIAGLAAKLKCVDHVFIYIVGHGNTTGVKLQKSGEVITPAHLKAWLCEIKPCKDKRCDLPKTSQCVCLVIESCKAGTFIDSGLPEKECQTAITSSKKTEYSYGYGRGTGKAAVGWFGRFWVEDLRNPTDKIVDCNEAFTTANAKTKAEAAKCGVPQTPQIKGECCDCDCQPPENECCYPRYPSDELNPDGTCPVTIIDTVIDEGTGVKRVVASIGGNVEFEADDISLPEYEFSFTVNLFPGDHVLVIEAWDYVDHYMYKEEPFTVKEGGGISIPPLVPTLSQWGVVGTIMVLVGVIVWQLRRRKVNLKA